ncbi:MAG: HRDC domain-containing protein [Desulfobacterales bacterium]|nr:HRDC domain-containing protein [Desulfobacterales bacterium]
MILEPQLIEELSGLESLGKQLAEEELLGVDIEADSLHHYFPKVCLIQISTNQHTFVIDPLAIQTIDPLRPLFSSHKTKKIFHDANYDLRSLFRDFSIETNNIFDTMVASQLIGEKEPGLSAVLKKRFGIHLNKKYQRSNWSKRPLPRNMLIYAGHDTAHLIRLCRALERELKSKGRLDWHEEECKRLCVECAQGGENDGRRRQPDSDCLLRRFKGARSMEPRDLGILESLLLFREARAMQEDRPPFRLFPNHVIKELVGKKPANRAALSEISGLSATFMKRYAGGALEAIQRGLELPEQCLPSFSKPKRLPWAPKKKARLKRLKAWRELKAGQLKIEPGLICNNVLLEALADDNPKHPADLKAICVMKKWQRKSFGKEIVNVLQQIS